MTKNHTQKSTHTIRALLVRIVCVCVLAIIPSIAHGEEAINSFRSGIEVLPDGSFTVTERIEYAFDGPHHGIFREIPLTHPEKSDSFFKKRVLDIKLTDVRLDGAEVPYKDQSTSNEFKIQIGDPNTTIEGVHEYAIAYTVHGGLWYPKGAPPELYFNITGNDWNVPILSAEALVHGVGLFREERSCYTGVEGSQGSCVISTSADDAVQFRTVSPLKPGEGMTIAQSLEYDKVARDMEERIRWSLILIPLALVGALLFMWRVYAYKTAFKTYAPIIAQYEPYPNVKPMYAGLLMDRTLDPRDVTAGIIYLAREGYVKIHHTEKKVFFLFEVDDYEITLTRAITDLQGAFEQELLVMLFNDVSAAVGTTISLADLKNNYSEKKKNYELLTALKKALQTDLKTQGFVSVVSLDGIFTKRFFVPFAIVAVALFVYSGAVFVCLLMAAALFFTVIADGRRTKKGYEALDHLKGFKEFLSVTDTERFAFHNAPKKSPEQFMEYLPYAIAFGVEKEWAEVFKDITIPSPDWYDGGNTHTFAPASLSNSLSAFGTSLASSGASASSGGGSSGGGSGGGGGGSW